jgi:hypothetical protein
MRHDLTASPFTKTVQAAPDVAHSGPVCALPVA